MRLIHLENLQKYAAMNHIETMVEAIESIYEYLNSLIEAENNTRLSFGTYNVSLLPPATQKDVECFLEDIDIEDIIDFTPQECEDSNLPF